MTEFTQLYLTPKIFLMGSSLAFSLDEDPVRCAKVCDISWVILLYSSVNSVVEFPGAGLGRLITINSELNGAI